MKNPVNIKVDVEEIKLFPLPQKLLHERFTDLFAAISNDQYVSLVGMPQSGRSGFLLASMMQCNEVFANEFDFKKNIFVSFNAIYKSVTTDEYIAYIVSAITKHLSKKDEDKCVDMVNSDRSSAALTYAFEQLKEVATVKKQKFIFSIWGLDELLQFNPEHLQIFNLLFNGYSPEDRKKIGLLFVLAPASFYKASGSVISKFLNEKVVLFKALDQEEIDYTRIRMELLRGYKVTDEMHKQFSELSQGYYGIYYRLFQQNQEINLDSGIGELLNDSQFEPFIVSALSGIKPSDRNHHKLGIEMGFLDNDGEFRSPLLKAAQESGFKLTGEDFMKSLTPQQRDIVSHLIANKDKIVSREDIAQHIWGKLWSVKYSDWAIDKQITAIRKALEGTQFRLSSVRGKGVRLSGGE